MSVKKRKIISTGVTLEVSLKIDSNVDINWVTNLVLNGIKNEFDKRNSPVTENPMTLTHFDAIVIGKSNEYQK